MLPFTFWPGALMMMSSSMVMMLLPKSAFVWAVPSKVVRSAWNSSSVSTSRMPAVVGNSETAPALLSLPMLSLGMPDDDVVCAVSGDVCGENERSEPVSGFEVAFNTG